jgi:hypothetical protein
VKVFAVEKYGEVRCERATFPLTLTLSLREREQPLNLFFFSFDGRAEVRRGFALRREAILPLPGGEGWGEGERKTSYPKSFHLA